MCYSLIKYAEKYGVTKAAIKYKTNRQYIYRCKRRYDGTLESLRNRSRRRNPDADLVVFWVKLKQWGYSRSIPGLYRFLRKGGFMAVKPPDSKYVPRPYEQMDYPGQRIQIDVKFVPYCLLCGHQIY